MRPAPRSASASTPSAAAILPDRYAVTEAYDTLRLCERLAMDPAAFEARPERTRALLLAYGRVREAEEARLMQRFAGLLELALGLGKDL